MLKLATSVAVAVALVLALSESRSVFSLVILAWSTLAAAFAPLLTLYALRRRVSEATAVVMLFSGVSIALFWRFGLGWHESIYEGLPGIAVPLVMGFALSRPERKAETN